MRSYIYQAPFGKGSTQICEIKNSNEEIVGSIQRYYNSKLYSLLDFLIGKSNLFVRVKAKDANGNMIINEIGRASCRERVYITVEAVELREKRRQETNVIV